LRAAVELELRSIGVADAVDAAHLDDALSWVASGAPLFRVAKPATPPKHLVSYCVVVSGEQVLLGRHRSAQRWLPPGGHVEAAEHPRAAVSRELREELGLAIAEDAVAAPLMVTCAETVGSAARHTDVSLWYVVETPEPFAPRYDVEEFSEMRWFSFAAAPLAESDPHLGRFLSKISLRAGAV
jgi:8-oxo-dGTP diphosphatase